MPPRLRRLGGVSLAALLAGAAGVCAAVAIVDLAALVAAGPRRRRGRLPAAVVGVLARVGRGAGAPAPPADLVARLAAAGSPLGLSAREVMAVKAGGALAALAAAVPLGAALPGRLGLVAIVAPPAGAFLAPDALLSRRARRRGAAMTAELPDLLDGLALALRAGLPPARAIGEVARRHRGPLAREWAVVAAEIELGRPAHQAIAGLRARCPATGIDALIGALDRGARLGAPLADALAAQAREARALRAARVREHAARAAPKIQLVVALALVPSVLLLVAAATLGTLGAR